MVDGLRVSPTILEDDVSDTRQMAPKTAPEPDALAWPH